MIISVDCNNDRVTFSSEKNEITYSTTTKEPERLVKILEELFSQLSEDPSLVIGVQLEKISEDHRTTIGDW